MANVNRRVQKHRDALRKAGLRPVQIWVPDTRRPDFAAECRRQSRLITQTDLADRDMQRFIDDALPDLEGCADLITIAIPGEFGKPRPALIIQAGPFDEHPTVTILPVTSTLVAAPLMRITVASSPENGLQKTAQVMIDKAVTVRREKLVPAFGRIDANKLLEVKRSLAVFLGIVK